MDYVKAQALFERLKGKVIGDWEIQSYKNHGKSAAVFLGIGGKCPVAVKIFDDELIEKYGDQTQIARIERELTLVGKNHPNMVKILGGGFDKITSSHYIVMEYLDGPNMKECLQTIPNENVGTLIQQLASAAKFLEDNDLVHRDIKPENIIILDNFSRLVLLDFGVIRFVGRPGLTDVDGIQPFIGTLQYSSPEFLLRQEVDSVEGWRALTFYQIGAVLHDLIMRKELFEEYSTPYAKLVNAVQHTMPTIQSSNVERYLVDLARMCLIKPPDARLILLDWRSFNVPAAEPFIDELAKRRVTNRVLTKRAEHTPPEEFRSPSPDQVVNELVEFLKKAVRLLRTDNELFPSIDTVFREKHRDRVIMRLHASEDHSLRLPLTIMIPISVVEPSARAVVISTAAYWGKAADKPLEAGEEFFKGPMDTTTIQRSLEAAIYRIVDAAQAVEAPVEGEWLQLSAKETVEK